LKGGEAKKGEATKMRSHRGRGYIFKNFAKRDRGGRPAEGTNGGLRAEKRLSVHKEVQGAIGGNAISRGGQ